MKYQELAQLYEQTSFSNIIQNIGGIPFPFNPLWKNIGISVSGGADSALLAYILATLANNSDTELHIISNVRMWKLRPWQRYNSIEVYQWLCSKFPAIKFYRHENFIPPDFEWGTTGPNIKDEYGEIKSGDTIEIRSHAEFIAHSESLDAYYNAVSHNPPVSLTGAMSTRNVEPTINNVSKMITTHMGRTSCHPFRFIDKSWIYKQYVDYGIMDLYKITRSCEGDTSSYPEVFKGLDYQTYTPGQYVPVCGQCFWCQERSWAESQQ